MNVPVMSVVVSLIVVAAVSVCSWILRRRRQHDLFRKHGIPGPVPELTWGNSRQLKEDPLKVAQQWIEKYGKVFGYFEGETPYMMISDVEMIKQCFVKESNTFHDRPPAPVIVEPFASLLIALKGEEWKRVRTVLNPSFSTSKMKGMMQIMSSCTDEMLEVLDGSLSRGDVVDIYKVSQGLALDVITKCALAWQVDCQRNPSDPLLLALRKRIEESQGFLFQLVQRFPFVGMFIKALFPYTNHYKVISQVTENVRQVIELRRNGQRPQTKDMLQLMLDAQSGRESETESHQKNERLIEDRHVIANSFIFLVAGFETMAISLGFIMHALAKHQEEQQRIFEELSGVFPEKGHDLTYDGIQQLKRLDMVISEALRMYSPAVLFVSRACKEDITVMGQFFPAGVNVIAPVWSIHHDPDLWPQPFKFDPERFAEGRDEHHPAAYLPFGIGPRMCIAQRFALLELKMAILKVIRSYRITPCAETQDTPEFFVRGTVIGIKNGIKVRFEHR